MTPPLTTRFKLPYGQLDDALTRLDSGIVFGGWAPRLDGIVAASRTFAYYGGFNSSGVWVDDGTIVIPDGTTKFIQRTAAGVVSADATLDLLNKVPMAIATAAGGVLTNYADMRETGFWMARAWVTALYGGDAGDLLYSDGTAPVVLAVGATPDGYVLTLDSGVPTWAAPTGGGGGGSPGMFEHTILQLHCDGTNGSTTFTDVIGRTVTASGNAQISTAQSKFGGASAKFDGTGDYLTVTAHKSLNLPNIFTIDFWVKTTQTGRQYATLIERDNGSFSSGSWSILFNKNTASDGIVYYANSSLDGSGTAIVSSVTAINDGNWHHVAVIGLGNNYFMFLDGVLEDQRGNREAPATNTAAMLIGKSVNASREFDGYLDEIHIVKGIATWIKDFNPPTSAYPDS